LPVPTDWQESVLSIWEKENEKGNIAAKMKQARPKTPSMNNAQNVSIQSSAE
jgi:hypothetical protein